MRFDRRLVRARAAAILLGLSLAIPVAAQAKADLSAIRIDNFGRVNANYYRGAQPEGRDYADLAAFGIKTVIDLQKDGDSNEAKLVQSAGLKFYRIAMTTHEPPTPEQLAQFMSVINDPANQPVYVHCAGGRHRTGVMTAFYRMSEDGWTADQAFREMKQYRFGPDFLHPEFKEFVYAYGAKAARATSTATVAATKGGS